MNEALALVGPTLVAMQERGYFCRIWCQSEVSPDRRWHVTFEKHGPKSGAEDNEPWPWARAEDANLAEAVSRAAIDATEREKAYKKLWR